MGAENNDKRQTQLSALRRARNHGEPFNLEMINKETGQKVYVPVRVKLREYNFNVAKPPRAIRGLFGKDKTQTLAPAAWGYKPNKKDKDEGLKSLLGAKTSNHIGGAVGQRIDQLEENLETAQIMLENAKSTRNESERIISA